MREDQDKTFMRQLNQNLGIAHKVCSLYFAEGEEKKDVLQEMMYQLWRSYPSFGGHAKFSTWMYRVCLNTALTYRRKNSERKQEPLNPSHLHIAQEPPSKIDEASNLLTQAITALSSLNKAIVLLYLEDLSYDEIAQITGLSKSNVSVRLVRIRKELETNIKNHPNQYTDVSS